MRTMTIALVAAGLLVVPGTASAKKAYGGDYSTKYKCEKAMAKEQKAYRKSHGKHAPQLYLRCKYKHGRYWLKRD